MDIRSALSFLAGEPCVDAGRIGLFGTSYGGGLVTWVAANDPRVKCVAAQVPGMGGGRGPAAIKYARDLAVKQARGETEPVPIETGKLTGKLATYAQMRMNPAKGIGYSPIEAAAKIKVPMLILVAEKEELMNNEENSKRSSTFYRVIRCPGTTTSSPAALRRLPRSLHGCHPHRGRVVCQATAAAGKPLKGLPMIP